MRERGAPPNNINSVSGNFQEVGDNRGNRGNLSEIQLQAECFQWTWNQHPETRRCIAHVPNGSSRNKIEAMQLKASGVVPGVHDLFFYWKGQLYWFELKVGSNTQSDAQRSFAEAMIAQGAICYEVRTFERFKELFESIVRKDTAIEVKSKSQ